jgi:hypothetical protein
MNIHQVIQKIDRERLFGSRFPVRLILVEHLGLYEDLVSRLASGCDATINISDSCNGDDVYPKFGILREQIAKNKGKHILLLSMGEYLRLRIKQETKPEKSNFPSFWQEQQDASSKTRVFVPMFASKELFERVVPFLDDRQKDYIWEISPDANEEKPVSISVFSPEFKETIGSSVKGVKKWFENWPIEFRQNGDCAIVTALYAQVENSNGLVTIRVIDNPFDYICRQVKDGHRLKREWASDKQWLELIPFINKNLTFSKTIENILNVKWFEPKSVMEKWDDLSPLKRQLVWIWYKLNSSDDYCGFVFRNANNIDTIELNFRDEIIRGGQKPQWITERTEILGNFKAVKYDSDYFSLLDTLPLPETRLKLLTYKTHEERAYAIKTISKWLKQGVSLNGILEVLNCRYPLLEQYLSGRIIEHEGLDKYFSMYREHKIANIIPEVNPEPINLDVFDSRYSLLTQYRDKDCFVLWIDGMGVEWLPLLLKQLTLLTSNSTIAYHIASSLLPTETKFNEQWKYDGLPYEKWDRLDVLAHKGMPDDKDYFSCIDNQLYIISDVAKKAEAMLNMHEYVVITSDHGSSRIAALKFHDSFGISAPQKAIVKSFGRYCELHTPVSSTDLLPFTCLSKIGNAEYLIMTNHDHYSISGNAAGGNDDTNAIIGEIHGGKTPEEYLIPVVVLKRRIALIPLDYSLSAGTVFKDKGSVIIEIQFNRDISTLEVSVETVNGACEKVSPKVWSVTFRDLEAREYKTEVIANGHLLSKQIKFIVKTKGIIKNEDPFGSL